MNEILIVQKDKIVCPSHLVEDIQCTVHIVCEKNIDALSIDLMNMPMYLLIRSFMQMKNISYLKLAVSLLLVQSLWQWHLLRFQQRQSLQLATEPQVKKRLVFAIKTL